MRESAIETKVCAYAKLKGWIVGPKAGAHSRGWPDRMFLKKGKTVFIEFKAPGEKPSPLQAHRIEKLTDAGFKAFVIDNVEEGIGVFNREY